MIKIIKKDLFESDAKIIAHQVNIEGVMGAGVALEIKRRYPDVYKRYKNTCAKVNDPKDLIGKIQVLQDNKKVIVNLFAESLNKNIEGNRKTNYDALKECFMKLNTCCKGYKVAIPFKIGCGLGGGDWNIVLDIIINTCTDIDLEICSIEEIEEQIVSKETTTNLLKEYFKDMESFTIKEAQEKINHLNNIPKDSVRGRIYEGLKKGLFEKLSKGVYCIKNSNGSTTLVINGDGRDLSFIKDNAIDCIITDHPWSDPKTNKGGNRSFADYECFTYNQTDFDEKYRVLKDGCFLVEIIPDENSTNFDYLYSLKKMAQTSGFEYYTKIPYIKGNFVSNTGRKSKNSEDIMIFSKGKARALKLDTKKNKIFAKENNLNDKLTGEELRIELEKNGISPSYFSGTNKMLPASFNYQPPSKKDKIHQSEKPVELIEAILDYLTLEKELVLDQFAGSGVVGEACLKQNRSCILIEKDDEIYQNIINRLSKLKNI